MKNFAKILFIMFIFLNFCNAQKFTTLPKDLEQNLPKNSITKIYGYSCIHCYTHFKADLLNSLQDIFPEVVIEEAITTNMGQYGEKMGEILAVARFLDDENKINSLLDKTSLYSKIVEKYFKKQFDEKKIFKNQDEFQALGLEILQINDDKFKEILSNDNAKKYLKFYKEISPISLIYGTPCYLISGKYLINPSEIKSQEDFVETISDLLAK